MHIEGRSTLRVLLVCAGCTIFFFCGVLYLFSRVSSEVSQGVESPSVESLKSLPYVTWTPIEEDDVKKTGVTKYEPSLSCKGINLYYTENKPGGYFFDMFGNVLHTFLDKTGVEANWQFIEPYLGNNFLVLIQRKALFMMDWDSNIKWRATGAFHHDIAVADSGDIYTLINGKIDLPELCLVEPVRNDWLVILAKDGRIKRKISFVEMISHNQVLFDAAKKPKERRYDFGKDAWDIFHTNTVEIVDKDIFSGGKRLFKKGDVLFCIRHLNLIGVMDVEREEIVWSWGMDGLDFPHHPSLLEDGNILIFDNGFHRDYSRVIELNPVTKEIEWEYKADSPESFHSPTRGSAQRLPNGNTLIAESDKGRVFEITRDGKIVWEFYNPEVGEFYNPDLEEYEHRRATIYRMMRIVDAEKYPRLKGLR